jgi:hypothetical protein
VVSEVDNHLRRWRDAGDTSSDWEVTGVVSDRIDPPQHHSTPLPLSSLDRISGHTVGEYAEIRQVG